MIVRDVHMPFFMSDEGGESLCACLLTEATV